MRLDSPAFEIDGVPVTLGEVLAGARLAGLLDGTAGAISDRLACAELLQSKGVETGGEALEGALDAWRTANELIAADQAERWLSDHGLELDDVLEVLELRILGARVRTRVDEARRAHPADPEEVERLLPVTALVEGLVPALTQDQARRAAAFPSDDAPGFREERERVLAARGLADPAALADAGTTFELDLVAMDRLVDREAAYRARVRAVVGEAALERELGRRRIDLVRIDCVAAHLRTEDAAREVLCCVRDDGEPLESVAPRARAPWRRSRPFLEDLAGEPIAARLASARAGELLGPVPERDVFALYQVVARIEPALADPEVRARLEVGLVERALAPEILRRVRFASPVRVR